MHHPDRKEPEAGRLGLVKLKLKLNYRCPKCGYKLVLAVEPSAPPVCSAHVGRKAVEMQRVS